MFMWVCLCLLVGVWGGLGGNVLILFSFDFCIVVLLFLWVCCVVWWLLCSSLISRCCDRLLDLNVWVSEMCWVCNLVCVFFFSGVVLLLFIVMCVFMWCFVGGLVLFLFVVFLVCYNNYYVLWCSV